MDTPERQSKGLQSCRERRVRESATAGQHFMAMSFQGREPCLSGQFTGLDSGEIPYLSQNAQELRPKETRKVPSDFL